MDTGQYTDTEANELTMVIDTNQPVEELYWQGVRAAVFEDPYGGYFGDDPQGSFMEGFSDQWDGHRWGHSIPIECDLPTPFRLLRAS